MNPASISREAFRLRQNPKIAPILLSGESKLLERNIVRGANLRAWTLSRLQQEADDYENGSPSSRVSALRVLAECNEVNLVGQSAKPADDLPIEDVREELREMIHRLFASPAADPEPKEPVAFITAVPDEGATDGASSLLKVLSDRGPLSVPLVTRMLG
jgi:hypothetical protein